MENPIVAYLGGVAILVLLVRSIRKRSMTGVIVPIAAACQYVPWIYLARVTFLYQYAIVTPFLAVTTAWSLALIKSRSWSRALMFSVVFAAAIAFGLLLPALDGWRMPAAYYDAIRHWLPWMFKRPHVPLSS